MRINQYIPTIICVVLLCLLISPLIFVNDGSWHPDNGEAAGFLFVAFASLGTFGGIFSFNAIHSRFSAKNKASFGKFYGLSCLVSSTFSSVFFVIYPFAAPMKWSNFDASLIIPITITQCFLITPFSIIWWLLSNRLTHHSSVTPNGAP